MRVTLTFIYVCICQFVFGQLTGTITSETGDPLPYVTVYSVTDDQGTLTNDEGFFEIELSSGPQTILVEYLGYEDYTTTLDFTGQDKLEIQLKERTYNLDELTVSANAEDPAYAIIREAIKRRKGHYQSRKKYSVDVYSKGIGKMIDSPESLLGNDIGNMEGMLDKDGKGIIYLAESESEYFFHQPNLEKEVVKSSIVAEGDDSFNINSFLEVEYDIYKPTFDYFKTVTNPLANTATTWYKYELLDVEVKADGSMINRIKVTPKNSSRPLMKGDIYINDKDYKVTQLDLSISGKAIGQSLFKTLNFQQIYHTEQDSYTLPKSQVTNVDVDMLGFKIKGAFTFIYNNYNFGNTELDPSFFGSEVYKFDKDAIVSDTAYWNKNRPIPLTNEERLNYIKKDSLKKVWNSKSYLDSLDRAENKFEWSNLYKGYTYQNSFKKSSYNISSLAKPLTFHLVPGYTFGIHQSYNKEFGSDDQKSIEISNLVQYGVADKRVKWNIETKLINNPSNYELIKLNIGDNYEQFGYPDMVFSRAGGSIEEIIRKRHLIKLYRKRFANLRYQRELINGLLFDVRTEYAQRFKLQNNTTYFLNKNAGYTNYPLPSQEGTDFFAQHDMWTTGIKLTYKPFQKYMSYQGYKISRYNNWPTFDVAYNIGFGTGSRSFQKLQLGLTMSKIKMNIFGNSYLRIEAGKFLQKENLEFIDQFHFRSANTFFTLSSQYKNSFKVMPLYEYSFDKSYVMNIYEHSFDGFILGSIPGIKKLGWSMVIGANTLIREDASNYFETSVGLKDIKILGFDILRVDYSWGFEDGKHSNNGVSLGLSIDL